MIRAARIDANHKAIVDKLRQLPGISVHSVAQLKGFADILVGYWHENFLFEIKTDKKKKLTDKEKSFQESWKGQVNTVTSFEEIIKIIEYPIDLF